MSHFRTICRQAMICCVFLCASVAKAGEKEDRELLTSLKQARAAVVAASPSGRGSAEGDGLQAQRLQGTELEKKGLKIIFSFSNGQYAFKESPLEAPDKVFRSEVGSPSRNMEFINVKDRPVGLTIQQRLGRHLVFPEPDSWSVEDLMSIPPFQKDDQLFGFLSQANAMGYDVKVFRDGRFMQLQINTNATQWPIEKRPQEHQTMTFDMSLGGVTTKYTFVSESRAPDAKNPEQFHITSHSDLLELTWSNAGGAVVPTSRSVHLMATRDGAIRDDQRSSIRFKEYVIKPVPLSDFKLDNLNIPVGVLVADEITGRIWRYFKGANVDGVLPNPAGS